MAKFLNTSGVTYHLEELLKNTREKLILISPYLQFSDRIKEYIQHLNIQKKDIRIVYRENKLHPDENNWLASQVGVRTSICKTLHAKCYINDHEAILTSMNLYHFSQVNNNEMGIYITKDSDPDLYKSTFEEAQRIVTISQDLRLTTHDILNTETKTGDKESKNLRANDQGFCIRTGVPIPFNIEKPLSYESFKKWNQYSDLGYPEKFCHYSGEPSNGETSVGQPILKRNWKKAKEKFGLK